MASSRRIARVAGLLYLIVVVTGIFSLMVVPSRLAVPGDPAATLAHIAGSGTLFRLGILAEAIEGAAFAVLPFAFYALLAPYGSRLAALMVAFALLGVAVSMPNLSHQLNVLSLLGGGAPALAVDLRYSQAMLERQAYGNGLEVCKIFWGLWLLPLGLLIYRSRLLPRLLGVLLVLGCVGYLVDFAGNLLWPAYAAGSAGNLVMLPASLGEILTCLWLLLIGVRAPREEIRSA